MATANLKAKISLDDSQWSASMRRIQQNVAAIQSRLSSVTAVVAGAFAVKGIEIFSEKLTEGVKGVLEVGSALSELSDRTGVGGRDLMVFQQAFKDAGVEAGSLGSVINRMQKALTGVNEQGEPTNKTFESLRLSIEQLQKLTPAQQFQTIGKAISGLSSPAERAAAAMGIFGKTGGELLAVFNNPAAFGEAAKALGQQATIFDRNAKIFDDISDKFNQVGIKFQGFFAGVAESLLPALKKAADILSSLDLAPMGQKLGAAIQSSINILVNAFKSGKFGELVGLSLKIGFQESIDFAIRGLRGMAAVLQESIGQAMAILTEGDFWKMLRDGLVGAIVSAAAAFQDAFGQQLKNIQDGLQYVFEHTAEIFQTKLGKSLLNVLQFAPGMGVPAAALKLLSEGEGAKGRSFQEIQQANKGSGFFGESSEALKGIATAAFEAAKDSADSLASKGIVDIDSITNSFNEAFGSGSILSSNLERSKEQFDKLAKSLNIPIEKVQSTLNASKGGVGTTLDQDPKLKKVEAASSLERIGAVIGGGLGQASINYARKTADHTAQLVKHSKSILDRLSGSGFKTSASYAS